MKHTTISILYVLITLSGCKNELEQQNSFSSTSDTLILKTERVKGLGLFTKVSGAGQISFYDTTFHYYYHHKFPENIKDIKLTYNHFDIKPFLYERFKNGETDSVQFLNYVNSNKIDTTNIPSKEDNHVTIMSGIYNDERVFIVDQNNNQDFRDDSIIYSRKLDMKDLDLLIKCKFNIYDGKKIKVDTTWVNFGTSGGNMWWFYVSHHRISNFTINQDKYQIGIFDEQTNFEYDDPMIALISQNGLKKDSLLKSEIYNKGEYLKLDEKYYQFADISNDGLYVTLVKEENFGDKVGTQKGMLAPLVKCNTIENDTFTLKAYRGSFVLLTNVTACWSKIPSYEYYKDLYASYSQKITIVGIDNSLNMLQANIKNLNLKGIFVIADKSNSSVQKYYREDNCSRTCFLIDKKGRIADKFEISDWKVALAKYID